MQAGKMGLNSVGLGGACGQRGDQDSQYCEDGLGSRTGGLVAAAFMDGHTAACIFHGTL